MEYFRYIGQSGDFRKIRVLLKTKNVCQFQKWQCSIKKKEKMRKHCKNIKKIEPGR